MRPPPFLIAVLPAISLLLPFLAGAADNSDPFLRELQDWLRTPDQILTSAERCARVNHLGKSPCDAGSYCILAPARLGADYFYASPAGGRLPNYTSYGVRQLINQCVAAQKQELSWEHELPWLLDPALRKNTAKNAPTPNRVKALLEETRNDLIARLDKFRAAETDPESRKKLEQMKARVSSIRLTTPDESIYSCYLGARAQLDTNLNDPAKSTVTICPAMWSLPEATLRFIFAHELSHSIDPCTNLFAKDVIRWSENPFKRTIECLSGRDSVGARILGDPARFSAEQLFSEQFAVCSKSSPGPEPQISEAFADWLATQTITDRFENARPSDGPRLATEALLALFLYGCEKPGQTQQDFVIQAMKKHGCAEKYRKAVRKFFTPASPTQEAEDAHPTSRARMEDIVLGNSRFAALLGCNGQTSRIANETGRKKPSACDP